MSIRKHGNILAGIPAPTGDVADGDSRPVSGDAVHDALQNYVPLNQKGAANGVAELDGNGKVPASKLPVSTTDTFGAVKVSTNSNNGTSGLFINSNGELYPCEPIQYFIDNRSAKRLINTNVLDYAVRSVLPNVTTIPAATTAYTLTDASATTNNHCHTYKHAPTAAPTYTLPAVTDATIEHTIILTVDTTETVAIAFEDSQGNAIVPIRQPYLVAGDVVQYLCWWDPVQSKWIVIGDLVNSLEDPSNDDIYGG